MGKRRINGERMLWLGRICFGLIFIWAAWDKLLHPSLFAEAVSHYKLLPAGMINPVSVILPWVEFGCGVFLITGVWVEGSLLILNGLLAAFLAALAFSIYRGLDIECGCFSLGAAGEKVAFKALGRDAVLLLFGLLVMALELRRRVGARAMKVR